MVSIFSVTRQLSEQVRNAYWQKRLGQLGTFSTIESGVRLDYPAKIRIGKHCSIGRNSLVRANTESACALCIGDRTSIKENVLINTNKGTVEIGQECWVGPYTLIYGNGDVTIGDHVMIASHCAINTVSHHTTRFDIPMSQQGIYTAPVVIEDDVWIGIGAVILQGIRVGKGSVIGAGAVVTRDIEPGTVVAGVPARKIKQRSEFNNERIPLVQHAINTVQQGA